MWPRIFSGWCFNYDDDDDDDDDGDDDDYDDDDYDDDDYNDDDDGDDLPDNIEIPKEDAAKSDAEDKNVSSDRIITWYFNTINLHAWILRQNRRLCR